VRDPDHTLFGSFDRVDQKIIDDGLQVRHFF
jgi:hypothetical protein